MSVDPALVAEQQHLADSRAALTRMRETSADWQTAIAGDHVSTQYLKQMLYRRMRSLEIDPDVPLFFGRLDYATDLGADADERLYVGRRHIAGELGGEPLVVDWRAPVSLPFYRARPGDCMGVRQRRRFGFHHGTLTAFEDEYLADASAETSSALLEAEIERPRTGPMRDIVATIQPDQDVLVRTDLATSLCIQGAPGTGKTAVGLHRAAYLLYAHREQLSRQGVLVVGPNDSFLSYIGDVLPALGEIDATQETIESLVSTSTGLRVKAAVDPAAAIVKGGARMAEVIRRAVWSHLRAPAGGLVVPQGSRQWRVPAHFVEKAVSGLTERSVRYEAGRALLPQRLAHQVLLRMEVAGDSPDDRVQNAVARSKSVKEYAAGLWPQLKAPQLVFRLLTDPQFLAEHAAGVLSEDEQTLVRFTKNARAVGSAPWSLADLVLVDEAADQLNRTPSLGHVIVDEAQDLSAMQLRAVGRRATTGSVTLLGDLAQATTPWASTAWADALAHLGKPEAELRELVEGFRVPGAVIDYAARLLPSIAPGLTPPRSIRHSRGELTLDPVAPTTGLLPALDALLEREGTIGLIVPDALAKATSAQLTTAGIGFDQLGLPLTDEERLDEHRLESRVDLVPASLAKGLEFDHVLLIEPAAIVAGEPDETTGLRRLYVCLTRAVSSLAVLHAQPLPAALAA